MTWWAVHLQIVQRGPNLADPNAAVMAAIAYLHPTSGRAGGSVTVRVNVSSPARAETYVVEVLEREGVGNLAAITGVTPLPTAGNGG